MSAKAPEPGDYVIVRIKDIVPYGAFVELVEYPDFRGFIHISEISNSWVKNIRHHIKEGQMRVAKVLGVSTHKRMCDLSLKRVSGAIEKRKLEEVRRKKRGRGLLRAAAKLASRPESEVDKIEDLLAEHFGDALTAFESVVFEGEHVLDEVKDLPADWKSAIIAIAKKSIEIPRKTVRAHVSINVPGPFGAKKIRELLLKAKEQIEANAHSEARIYYVGAPRYAIEVTTTDYKVADKILASVCDDLVQNVQKLGGSASWEKVEA
ncbi:MAG: S1 RNA-binding domain-containing protein [Candidatus Diapherotrites archaeon]|nr:S1 RNA-binding domain-containing protein [Candidatus Diapherotrites archaeon]